MIFQAYNVFALVQVTFLILFSVKLRRYVTGILSRKSVSFDREVRKKEEGRGNKMNGFGPLTASNTVEVAIHDSVQTTLR